MEKLYNALSEQGKYTKSFEDFQTQFGSKEGQEKLYGALESSGDYTKSFEDFSGQFFSSEPAKTNDSASADPAVESNQNSTGSESEEPLSAWQSIKNTFKKAGERMYDVVEFWATDEGTNSGLDIATNSVYSLLSSQEDVDEYVKNNPGWMSEGIGSEKTIDAIKKYKIEQEEGNFPTKGLVASAKDGDIGGIIAGSVEALVNTFASGIYSFGTVGAGIFSEVAAENYITYNEQKADNLGISLEELIRSGKADNLAPVGLGAFSTALEGLGLGKSVRVLGGKNVVKNMSAKLIYNRRARNVANILASGGTEFTTEILQHATDKINEELGRVAGTKDDAKVVQVAFDAIFSEEGLEAGLQGLIGGSGLGAMGVGYKAMNTIRTVVDGDLVDKNLEDLSKLRVKFNKATDKTEKAGIQKLIDTKESEISDSVRKGYDIANNSSKEQLKEIENLTDLAETAASQITELNKKFRSGEIDKAGYELATEGFKSEYKKVRQSLIDMELEKNIGLAKKESESKGLDFTELETTAEVEAFMNSDKVSEGNRKIYFDNKSKGYEISGFAIGNNIIINKELARKTGSINVGMHEVLHPVFEKLVGGSKEQGKMVKQFKKAMTSSQRRFVDKQMKKRGYTGKEYNKEYVTVFSDALRKKQINYDKTVFEKIGDAVVGVFKPVGYTNIGFENGKDVYNFIKEYDKSAEQGKFTGKATGALKDFDLGSTKLDSELLVSKSVADAEADLDAAIDADPDNPSYLDNIDKAEAELDAAEAAAKAPSTVVPEVKKEVKSKPKVERPKEPTRTTDLGPRDPLSQKIMDTYDEGMEGVERTEYKASKPLPSRLEGKLVPMFEGYINTIVQQKFKQFANEALEFQDALSILRAEVSNAIRTYNPAKNKDLAGYVKKIIQTRQSLMFKDANAEFAASLDDAKGVTATEDTQSIDRSGTVERGQATFDELDIVDDTLIEDIKNDLEKEIRVRVQKGTLSEMISVKKGRETYLVSWLENYVNKQLFKKLSKKLGAIAGVYPNAVIPGSYIDFLNDPKTFDIITKALPIKSIKKSYSKLFPVERVGREVTAEGNPVFKISKIDKKAFLTYFVKGNKSTVLERQKQLFREILEPLAKQVVADYATPENLSELKSIQELAPAESMDVIENIVIDAQLSNLESQLDRFKGEEKSFDIIQFNKGMSPNAPTITNELLFIAGLDAESTLLKDSTRGKQKFYLDRLKEYYKTREEFMDFLPSFITQFRGLATGILGFVYREDGSYYDFYRYNYKKIIDKTGETVTDKKQLNELFKRGTASFKNKLLDSKGSKSEYSDVTKNLIKEVKNLIEEADLGKLTPNLHYGRVSVAKETLNKNIVIDAALAQEVLNHLSKNNALNAKIAELYISLLRDFVKTSKKKKQDKQAKAAVVNMLLATNNTVNGWRSLASISSIIYNKNKVTDYYFEHNDSMKSVLPNILVQILGEGPISFKVDSSLIPVDLANTKNKKQETKVGNKSVTDKFYKEEIAKDKNLETVTIQLSKTTEKEFNNLFKQKTAYYHGTSAVVNQKFVNKEIVKDFPEGASSFSVQIQGLGKHYTKSLDNAKSFIDHRNRKDNTGTVAAVSISSNNPKQFKTYQDLLNDIESTVKNKNISITERNKEYLSILKSEGFDSITYKEGPSYNPSKKSLMAEAVIPFDSAKKLIGSADYKQRNGGIVKGSAVAIKQNIQFSKEALSNDFNDIIQSATGIDTNKIVSEAKGKILGKKKGRFRFFLPPSAEDFAGLLYKLLGKNKEGDTQQAWFKKNLFDPFGAAMQEFESYKQNVTGIVNQLKKEIKKVPSALKKTNSTGFTNEVAVRVYLWAKNGYDIKGLTETDKKELIDIVEGDPDLIAFATQMDTVLNGYPEPQNDWLAGTITTDAINMINTTKRAEFLQEWQTNADAIFTEDNLNKLRAAFGENYVEAMKDMLYRMKSGRNRPSGANKLTNNFNNWVNDSVGTIMFFNTRSALLQTLSIVNFINWGDNNPIQAAKAFANQKQFWSDFSMLFNSDFLKQRRSGLKNDVNADDIANAAETATNKSKAVFASILKMGFLPTQMADSFAIAMGGASFVRNRISKYVSEGMDKKVAEEKAFLDFQEIAEETQQSSRPDRISQQQASPLGRIVLAFANTPMQYMRLTKKAFLDLKNGRGDAKTNITKIIYYSVVQNVIFSALQSALFATLFEEDDEEAIKDKELRIANSMLDSILRGSGVYGAVASTLKNIVVEIGNQASKDRPDFTVAAQRALSISPPIDSKMRKIMGAARAFSYKTTRDKMKGFGLDNPAYYATGQVVSAAFNLPLDRVIRKADNLRVAVDNDTKYWQSIALMLGYSQWDLGLIQSEKKKKKSGFGKTTKWTKGKWKK